MDIKIEKGKLKVSKVLVDFLENEVLHVVGFNIQKFWQDFENLILKFAPLNKRLLQKQKVTHIKNKFRSSFTSREL